MTWHYRCIVYVQPPHDDFYTVAEVYKADDGRIEGWCPAQPGGGSRAELLGDLEYMRHDAMARPVLYVGKDRVTLHATRAEALGEETPNAEA